MKNDNHHKKPLISVCIPTYEMRGLGPDFLRQSFDMLVKQTFRDFDVIISDYSVTDVIKKVCDEYAGRLPIHYSKNPDTHYGVLERMSANTNNVIRQADGKLIKILFLDDFLYSKDSLKHIADNFDLDKDHWLVTGCIHTKETKNCVHFYDRMYPTYNKLIHLGANTISSPSVLTIKNDHPLFFDTNLTWLMDCDYYKRCFDAFGPPKIVNEISVVNRMGAHQTSNTEATDALREKDYEYVVKKFGERKTTAGNVRYLWRKIKRKIHAKTEAVRGNFKN